MALSYKMCIRDRFHSVLPKARLSGPATTGPFEGSSSQKFLRFFLEHCRDGANYYSQEKGTRLDFITFHVKGGGFPFAVPARTKKEDPSVERLLLQVRIGMDVVRECGYGDREIVLSEADPDGWAAGGMYDNANLSLIHIWGAYPRNFVLRGLCKRLPEPFRRYSGLASTRIRPFPARGRNLKERGRCV